MSECHIYRLIPSVITLKHEKVGWMSLRKRDESLTPVLGIFIYIFVHLTQVTE